MRKVLYGLFLALLIYGIWSLSSPEADANHDLVYAPCDPEDTRPLDEQVWYIDYQSGDMLRFDDPWWSKRPGQAGYTNWHHQCRLGVTGVWQAAPILPLPHPPTHTVESRDTIRTTTTTTTTEPPPTTTGLPTTTTTTTTTTTISSPDPEPIPDPSPPEEEAPLPSIGLPDDYDLWDAQYEGWPFEQTIILLEDRYPPGTPGKVHFRLSSAVVFLREGGMIGGLDFLWDSNG